MIKLWLDTPTFRIIIKPPFFPCPFSYTKPVDNEEDLVFDVTSTQKERVFVVRHKHYLGSGLYLWRYRVNKEVQGLTIAISYKGDHVGGSPYHLGDVLSEKCDCPSRSLDQWLADNKCRTQYQQIEEDLKPYRDSGGIELEGLYERLKGDFHHSHGVHYSIINNQVQ